MNTRWRPLGLCAVVACLLLGSSVLPGCKDEEAQQRNEETVATLRAEREEMIAQRDQARQERDAAKAALHERYGNKLDELELERDRYGEQIDQAAGHVKAILSATGTKEPPAVDRSGLRDLARDAADKVRTLRQDYDSLVQKNQVLDDEVASLRESLQRAVRPAAPAGTSQPDVLRGPGG